MDRLYVFLIRNDVWIYILSAIGLIWYLTEYWRSRRILRSAMFGLEKEKGQQIRRRAITFAILLLGIIALVTYVNLSVAPTLPAELLKPPTPTPNIFSTPLAVPTKITPQGTTVLEVAPTVTLSGGASNNEPTPGGSNSLFEELTETPYPAVVTGDCPQEIRITSPPNGTAVGTTLTLFGTVMGEQFNSYTLETLGPETGGAWLPLTETTSQSVQDGILGAISFEDFPKGVYFIRLQAFNLDGEELGQCTIELLVGLETS